MSKTELVRASRDGDQFHYLWAARRCLSLLDPMSKLVAIAIEGASQSETPGGESLEVGEALIDVAEYYGSEEISQATRIAYIQLKHSTYRASEAWTIGGLAHTLRGFSDRYSELLKNFDKAYVQSSFIFCFTSNRPIQSKLLETISDLANNRKTRHVKVRDTLQECIGHDAEYLADFCRLLQLEGNLDDYWEQRNILFTEVSGYLPGLDVDAPVQLKELVNRKALSESVENPTITKLDVLRAFKVDENDLFPAPCLIPSESSSVPREQEPEIISAINEAVHRPVIVHADGGVGKSVFARRIRLGLPQGSVCILYDCFGNGQYRNASGFRHRHRDAIPQIANELAGQGLCHPLIPTPNADSSDYLRAFFHRLQQSVRSIAAQHPSAILCIVIDAADNAQMAAAEIGERRSFVRDFLREKLPEGVRLVALCRSHRQDKLDPPPGTKTLELLPFSRAETSAFLRQSYPNATKHDVDEFHRLSSQNPRVQALAIDWGGDLGKILRKLGPNPTSVEDTIGALLDQAIAQLRDNAGSIEGAQIDRICTGLAALRPRIPISVLASMSGVTESAIRSFAFDLGRPLIVTDGTIQFFDEPAETWFRERFKPKPTELSAFVDSLKPLANSDAYVAAVLPQLMLEAGNFPELVALALSSDGLPENSPLERRDVELQRLQFALKASLRSKHYLDAAKLAMRAAGETAGDDRQRKLLQQNTDLAAVFLNADGIQEVVSRRTFGSDWTGSNHAYEAALMSGNSDLLGEARNRLRMANAWLHNWSRLTDEERQREAVSVEDIAEIAMAELNIHGAVSAADSLRRWRPRTSSFQAGVILARRLVDHGRYQKLDELALAARNDVFLVLAIVLEMRAVHRSPPKQVIDRILRLLLDRRVRLSELGAWDYDATTLHSIICLVEAALASGDYKVSDLIAVLDKYLPEEPRRGLASSHGNARYVLIRAYSLHAALASRSIELEDLAHSELKTQLLKQSSSQFTREVRKFRQDVGSVLPWHRLGVEAILGRVSALDLISEIEQTKAESKKAQGSWCREEPHISNEIARLWLDILVAIDVSSQKPIDAFCQWVTSLEFPLFTTTLTQFARLMARTAGLQEQALEFSYSAFQIVRDEREHADAVADAYVDLSRAILTINGAEAEAYFDAAVEVASKIGDEVIDRWGAMIDLADRAASSSKTNPQLAYRFARCAEMIYGYMARDKYFDWEKTVSAIAGLCSSSAIAILSRWRDRDFGSPARNMPTVVHSLVDRGALDPKIALGLVPFRANWKLSASLDAALAASPVMAEKQDILNFFGRYAVLEGQSEKTWRSIKQICASHGLALAEINEFIGIAARRERSTDSNSGNAFSDSREAIKNKHAREWDLVFQDLNLTVAEDVADSYERFRAYDSPYDHDEFFREICRRIPAGSEAEFIEAVGTITSLELYHYRSLLDQIPEGWKSRVSTKPALARLIRSVCRRFCMEITKSGYYQSLPLDLACAVSGLKESELIETVLSAIGEATQIVGASRLFTLVGLLATKLTRVEACDALTFTLDDLDDSLEEGDGDGLWSETLAPPADMDEVIAGYLWAALAAPQASYRWEAAHSVRGMCAMGQAGVLRHLMLMLANGGGGPFVDARLHFYDLHAKQWLLIALARATKERPALIVPYVKQLAKIALGGTQHVLIREFAARTVLALMDTGHHEVSVDEENRLLAVNRSTLPVIKSKSYERTRRRPAGSAHDADDDDFYFGIDMGPYWYEPLGSCFDVSQVEVERRARDVIRNEWAFTGSDRWDADERVRRGVFNERDTHHSHGSYPRSDNLRFYLSYHAMMVVAGQLLATHSLHEDPEFSWHDFESWLSRHDLCRTDGSWLADCRDAPPLEWPEWKDETSLEDWRWSLNGQDFERALFGSDGEITVWGSWTEISGQRQESVRIMSALVTTNRAQALLRALQTATNSHDYCIPGSDDDSEIEHGEFCLKGWIVDQTNESGIDDQDPWAGGIHFPPPRPARFIVEFIGLSLDPEQRFWRAKNGHETEPVLWSNLWGHFRDQDEEDEGEGGRRLKASMPLVQEFLSESGNDLLVEVEMSRKEKYSRYFHRQTEGLDHVLPCAKLFLIRGDGSVHTI
jgi:hypothetical protein